MKRARLWMVGVMGATCLVVAMLGLSAYSQMDVPVIPRGGGNEPPAPGQKMVVPAVFPPPGLTVPPGKGPVVPVTTSTEEIGPPPPRTSSPPLPLPLARPDAHPVQHETKVEIPSGPIEVRPGRQEPSVSLEWVGPATVRLGQPVNYQLQVRNISPGPVHLVTLHHRLPPGVIHRICEPAAVVENEELVWSLGTLQPGQMRKVDIQIVPQQRGDLTGQAAVTFTGATVFRFQVRDPQLVVKVNAPEKVMAGESTTLTLNISNPGDGPAEGIKVKALLPEGLEHPRGRVVEVDLGNLAAKENRAIQLVCLAKNGGGQRIQVMAQADGNLTANDSAQMEVVLPRLDLAVSGPKLRYVDRRAVYVFKVSNPGSAPASNVQLNDVIPAGFKFLGASGGGRFDETTRTVAWFVGDLPPGQNREVTVDLMATGPGDQRQHATVNAGHGLKTEAEVHTRVEGLSALVVEVADVDDPVEVGVDTAYEIRVSNAGTKMETNVELVCTLPENMEFKGARSGAGCRFRVAGREVLFEPLPRLAPRADAIYRLNVRCLAPGNSRFRAQLRADGLTEPLGREESTRVYSDEAPLR